MKGLFIPWDFKPECCLHCPCCDGVICYAGAGQLTKEQVYYTDNIPEKCPERFIQYDEKPGTEENDG